MPISRDRTFLVGGHGGTARDWHTGEIVGEGSWIAETGECQDTIGNFPAPNPVYIRKTSYQPSTMTGHSEFFIINDYDNYPMFDDTNDHGVYAHVPEGPSIASAVTDVQAATNPSRPDVSVPNFLYELKDIPELLHLKGREHAKKRPSNTAVEGNFGWDLLFKDVARIIDFSGSVNKRVMELKRLHSKGGMKRRRTVFSGSGSVDTSTSNWSFEVSISSPVHIESYTKQWVSVRWVPDSPNIPSADDMLHQARLAVHGWDGSSSGLAAVVWEAIPWSWLADYFGNVGAYLNANRNSVGAHATNVCWMQEIHTEWTYGPFNISNPTRFTCTPGYYRQTEKFRVLAEASLTATLPMLSHKQLSTLSSIAFNLNRK